MRSRAAVLLTLALIAAVATGPADAQVVPAFAPGERLICPSEPTTCGGGIPHVEPAIEVRDGKAYVSAQVAIPAGTDLFARQPDGTWRFMQKVDEIPAVTQRTSLAPGGGDSSLAIDSSGTVYVSSLWLGSNSWAISDDGGETMTKLYQSGRPLVDRQWIAADGDNVVYMSYRDVATSQIWVSKSLDGGLTWPVNVPIAGSRSIGNIEVDQRDHTVYQLYLTGNDATQVLTVARSEDGITWTQRSVYTASAGNDGVGILTNQPFPVLAIDTAGNLYVAFGDQRSIFLLHSTDRGETWSAPVKVSDTPTSIYHWIVAGDPGRVGVAWLGTNVDPGAAYHPEGGGHLWYAYYAQTIDGLAQTPSFVRTRASDDPVHKGYVCTRGLACDTLSASVRGVHPDVVGGSWWPGERTLEAGGRELAEVVQMALDDDGYVLIAYPDSCEAFNHPYRSATCAARFAHSVIAKQTAGDTLYVR